MMLRATVPVPIIITAIWVLAAWPYRVLFAPIFQPSLSTLAKQERRDAALKT
jgi:hypothetical protein